MNEAIANALVALKKNRFDVFFAENKEEAREIALQLIPEGASVAVGGSATLNELDLLTELRSGRYRFIDRYDFATPAEREENSVWG